MKHLKYHISNMYKASYKVTCQILNRSVVWLWVLFNIAINCWTWFKVFPHNSWMVWVGFFCQISIIQISSHIFHYNSCLPMMKIWLLVIQTKTIQLLKLWLELQNQAPQLMEMLCNNCSKTVHLTGVKVFQTSVLWSCYFWAETSRIPCNGRPDTSYSYRIV